MDIVTLEYRIREDHEWLPVNNLAFEPGYSFENARGERYPYETYALIFSEITCLELRLIGRSGGSAQFTSLARIAAYQRDFSRWNPTNLVRRPAPSIFELVSPEIIWDLSENLVKLTGLPISFGIMQFFLDGERFNQHLRRLITITMDIPIWTSCLGRRLVGKTGTRFRAGLPSTWGMKSKHMWSRTRTGQWDTRLRP